MNPLVCDVCAFELDERDTEMVRLFGRKICSPCLKEESAGLTDTQVCQIVFDQWTKGDKR
jgi:hypothetical protein